MQLTYTLTLEDFKAGLNLHMRQKISRRIDLYFSYGILPILVIVGSITFILVKIGGHTEFAEALFVIDTALVLLSLFMYYVRGSSVNKRFRKLFPHPGIEQTRHIDIDDERIISKIPQMGKEEFSWDVIETFAQDEKMTLLYFDNCRFLFFPTRILSPTQKTEFNELVARNMVRKEK